MNTTTRQELEALATSLESVAARIRAALAQEQPPPKEFRQGGWAKVPGCDEALINVVGETQLHIQYSSMFGGWVNKEDCTPL